MLSDRQRHEYEPPPCRVCGSALQTVHWVEATSLSQDPDDPDEPRWIPGQTECPCADDDLNQLLRKLTS